MARISAVDSEGEAPRDFPHLHFGTASRLSQESARAPTSTPTRGCATSPTRRSRACATTSSNLRVEGDLRRTSPRTSSARWSQLLSGRAAPQGLPVHGQRTHTNARTRKARRRRSPERRRSASRWPSHRKDHSAPASSGAKNVAYGVAHIKSSFNTRSSRSPTPKATSPGRRRATWLQGLAQVHPFAPSCRRSLCRVRWSTACARSTFWCVAGLGRETAIRSSPPPASRSSASRRHTHPHNGCRPRSGAGSRSRKRRTDMAHTPDRRRLCRRRDETVLERRALLLAQVPRLRGGDRPHSRAYPPGEHGRDRMRQV